MSGGIAARGVSYEVGGHRLLSDVSLALSPGQLGAIVGPSGAGKSTLLKVLCGVKRPARGQVTVAGLEAHRASRTPDLIGYVPQDDIVHRALRVEDVFRYTAELRLAPATPEVRRRRVEEVLTLVGLAERRQVRVRRLSGGQRKRVSIGVELIAEPRVLFLDEPTSGLDPGLERQMMGTLRGLARGDRTVLLTTHIMESMDAVDLLAVVSEGYLAFAGPPATALGFFRVGTLRELFDALAKQPGRAWQRALERSRPQLASAPASIAEGGDVGAVSTPTRPSEPPAAADAEEVAVDAALAALKQKMERGDG